MAYTVRTVTLTALFWTAIAGTLKAESTGEEKINALEKQVAELSAQLESLKQDFTSEKSNLQNQAAQIEQIEGKVEQIGESSASNVPLDFSKFHFGGYGEVHANFQDNAESDVLDFHRMVLYLGYDFSDWISFHSEWELEHAFVSTDSDGEFVIEQAYVDFLLSEYFNVRAGRVLTPLGITNKKHEPPLFLGVERTAFDKYIIPTTWSSDGIGFFGQLNRALSYEFYVVGGLDGSQFTETSGIRDGRIKERASLNDVAYTGRLDYYPLLDSDPNLRVGVSGYWGGLDNGNNGDNPGIDSDIAIYSADFEYSIWKFDLTGAVAHTSLSKPEQLGKPGQDIAEEIFGWYLQTGYHFWPEEWKKGKLKDSDAVVFVRYDDYDTQYKMPSGVARNPKADRTEWTVGVNFYLTPNLVVKADYQMPDSAGSDNPDDRFNLGLGWSF